MDTVNVVFSAPIFPRNSIDFARNAEVEFAYYVL